jgi:hypothetical protein
LEKIVWTGSAARVSLNASRDEAFNVDSVSLACVDGQKIIGLPGFEAAMDNVEARKPLVFVLFSGM